MSGPSLAAALLHPRRELASLARSELSWRTLPWRAWGGLAAIAVGGSLIYGASLTFVMPGWRPRAAGLWLTVSSGAGWCFFGPALVGLTRRDSRLLAHACLVTMAFGEAVLACGALVNCGLRLSGRHRHVRPGRLNLAIVAASNVVMACALTSQLRALGVPARTTLAAWLCVLNGCGALTGLLLRRRLLPPGEGA